MSRRPLWWMTTLTSASSVSTEYRRPMPGRSCSWIWSVIGGGRPGVETRRNRYPQRCWGATSSFSGHLPIGPPEARATTDRELRELQRGCPQGDGVAAGAHGRAATGPAVRPAAEHRGDEDERGQESGAH